MHQAQWESRNGAEMDSGELTKYNRFGLERRRNSYCRIAHTSGKRCEYDNLVVDGKTGVAGGGNVLGLFGLHRDKK